MKTTIRNRLHRPVIYSSILMITIGFLVPTASVGAFEETAESLATRRALCGVGSLYVLLRLHQLDVDYDQVALDLGPSLQGHSLRELRDAADKSGLTLDICHASNSLKTLGMIQMPVLIHTRHGHVRDESGPNGHFLVVERIMGDNVQYIDATTGSRHMEPLAAVEHGWTGYMLVLHHGTNHNGMKSKIGMVAVFAMIAYAISRHLKFRMRPWPLRIAAACLAPIIVADGTYASTTPSPIVATIMEKDTDSNWRSPERDAVNCTYVFLRYYGVEVNYSDLCDILRRRLDNRAPTLLDVKWLCQHFGIAASIVRCRPNDELRAILPAISSRGIGEASGERIVVLFNTPDSDDRFYSINGGMATVECITSDDFRRSWSGVVVACDVPGYTVPVDPVSASLRALAITIGALTVGILIYWRSRVAACLALKTSEGVNDGCGIRVAHSWPRTLFASTLLVWWALWGRPAYSQVDTNIRNALIRNAEALDPLNISFRWERQSHLPDDTFFPLVAGPNWVHGDRTFLNPIDMTYTNQKGLFRAQVSFTVADVGLPESFDTEGASATDFTGLPFVVTGRTVRTTLERSFDGNNVYIGDRRESGRTPHLVIKPAAGNASASLVNFLSEATPPVPVLNYFGLRYPSDVYDSLGRPMGSAIVELIDSGAAQVSTAKVHGETGDWVRLDLTTTDDVFLFDLDPEMNYAVRRFEARSRNSAIRRIATSSDLREVDGHMGVWFPYKWAVSHFEWNGIRPVMGDGAFLTERFYITSLDTKPVSASRFTLVQDYSKPGTHVGDETLPEASQSRYGQITYVVPANASDLDDVISMAIEESRPTDEVPIFSLSRIVIVAVVSVAILILIVVMRRRGV